MPDNCNSNCSNCALDCSSRTAEPTIKAGNPNSRVNKTIGIISGKGGVGKSFVTGSLASAMKKKNHTVGIIDADITGSTVAKEFGIDRKLQANAFGMLPEPTKNGIDVVSMNMLLDDPSDPVVWRGPIIASAVQQFWTDVQWGDKEYLFVDMPPGTGDVALTVFQSLPVDGIIIVTTPQESVALIVEKAVKMAEAMDIPILGIIENMSYLECPDCGKRMNVFGKSHLDEIAKKYNIRNLGQIPINPEIPEMIDAGELHTVDTAPFEPAVERLESLDA